MIELSIIIPCYNESKSIKNLLYKCESSVANFKNIEFIFVDNGSTDNTYSVFKNLSSVFSFNYKVLSVKKNLGYGGGIIHGLNNSSGKFLAWTHADLQTDPVDVVNAFLINKTRLLKENVIIKGKRKNRSYFDDFFTKGMSLISSIILNSKLHDVNAQPKVFSKIFYKKLKNPPHDFSLDLFFLFEANRMNYKIINYDVLFNNREFGIAKGGGSFHGKIKLIYRTLSYIFKLRKRFKNGNYNSQS